MIFCLKYFKPMRLCKITRKPALRLQRTIEFHSLLKRSKGFQLWSNIIAIMIKTEKVPKETTTNFKCFLNVLIDLVLKYILYWIT